MEDKKLFGGVCPQCGKLYNSYQFTKIALGPGAQISMSCENSHNWLEFYNLSYQGFLWNDKNYDSYGELLISENKTN